MAKTESKIKAAERAKRWRQRVRDRGMIIVPVIVPVSAANEIRAAAAALRGAA